jgi:hypothetical protein
MGRCCIKTRSGRCTNQALPGKHTCGRHPKRKSHSTYTRKHRADEVLGHGWEKEEEKK